MTPLFDSVLILPDPNQQTTTGGLVVEADQTEPVRFGTVEAIGPGRLARNGQRCPMSIQPKQRVMYETWAGTPVETERGERLLMSESDVLAVLD